MSKRKTNAAAFPDMRAAMSAIGGGQGMEARAQAFWDAQSQAAGHVQGYMDHWFERRRRAAAAARDLWSGLLGSNPSAAAKAWTDWTLGAMERLQADASEGGELIQALVADYSRAVAVSAPVENGGRAIPINEEPIGRASSRAAQSVKAE